jgi:hypothetical protein
VSVADRTSRRDLLRAGGLTAVFGAVAAACSSDGDRDPATAPGMQTTTTEGSDESAGDVALLNTALSLEVLAFDTYQAAFDQALVAGPEVTDALRLFQEHHAEHRETLTGLVDAAGGEPFWAANPVVKTALVGPSLASVTVERDFLRLAHELEQATAQLYVHATAGLSTAELRSAAMSIGAVASRRATVLGLLGNLGNERAAVYPADNPLPSDAIVTD